MARSQAAVHSFNFRPGRRLGGKYEVEELLGRGWEGEVYRVRELATGIERAAKFFYPERQVGDKAIAYHAKKLDRLRQCDILISYLTHDQVRHRGQTVKFLVSEYVEGELLEDFVRRQPGHRLPVFEALHLLHTLVAGLEQVHLMRDYHGDLHWRNIIVRRQGIGFNVKLFDIYRWHGRASENIREDVCDVVKVFYDVLGGRATYRFHPPEVKAICCGLKRHLILQKFKTAGELRTWLETMEWEEP